MTIHILGRDIELKQTMRSYIIYENIKGATFVMPQTITDMLVYFYATLIGSTKGQDIFLFEEFLDYVDEHPDVITEFSDWLVAQVDTTAQLSAPVAEDGSEGEVAPN